MRHLGWEGIVKRGGLVMLATLRSFRIAPIARGERFNIETPVLCSNGGWLKKSNSVETSPPTLRLAIDSIMLWRYLKLRITAGSACNCSRTKVYSWGYGKDGRLGHGDYKDRWEPCQVGGLGPEPVGLIAAGTAHSMVVSLPQSVHMWGRG